MKQFLTCYLVCLVGLVIFTFFGGLNLLFFPMRGLLSRFTRWCWL